MSTLLPRSQAAQPKVRKTFVERKAELAPKQSDLFQGKYPSLWNLWKDGASSSFLNSFLGCLEHTRLSYVEGWTPRNTPMSFEFGTCVHWVLGEAYSPAGMAFFGNRTNWLNSSDLEGWITITIKRYEQIWRSQTPDPTSKQEQQLELCFGLAEAVLPSYFIRWDGDFNGGTYFYQNQSTAIKEWVSLEENFEVPYTFPDGKLCKIRGRRDGVFHDQRCKKWVFDSKCRSVINHEDALDTLPQDLQQMLYLYVTRLEYNEWPEGTVMNIIRRPGHRQKVNESLPDFLSRIKGEVSDARNYDHNFTRYQMGIGHDELIKWKEATLDPLMAAVRMWWEGTLPHYLNHNSLITKYGHSGMFNIVCKNDYSQHYKRTSAFNEL